MPPGMTGSTLALALFAAGFASSAQAQTEAKVPKTVFRDCPSCPEMVVLPSGSFLMGSPAGPARPAEQPQHKVTFAQPFAVGRFEITFDNWDACLADGGCNKHNPDDFGFGRGRRPVTDVTRSDIANFTAWLSRKTGKSYRLLTEAEWEYAARGGTTGDYFWGDLPARDYAHTDELSGDKPSPGRSVWTVTIEAGSLKPNAYGVFDTAGNATELVSDCYETGYGGAPENRAPEAHPNCRNTVRGGSSIGPLYALRSSWRATAPDERGFGFRIARSLTNEELSRPGPTP